MGLAGAKFGSDEGYTIFSGMFYSFNSNASNKTIDVLSKNFNNPVKGIIGWFGSSGNSSSLSSSNENALTNFSNITPLEPKFIAPNVYFSGQNMNITSVSSNGAVLCSYELGKSTTIIFRLTVLGNTYGVICVYCYIFF